MALPAMKEYYEFIESDHSDIFRKMGTYAWLGMAIAFVETLAAVKFGHGLFPEPWPRRVVVAWGTGLAAFCLVFGMWTVKFYWLNGRSRAKSSGLEKSKQTGVKHL
jgi:phosphatidylserine synthase 2